MLQWAAQPRASMHALALALLLVAACPARAQNTTGNLNGNFNTFGDNNGNTNGGDSQASRAPGCSCNLRRSAGSGRPLRRPAAPLQRSCSPLQLSRLVSEHLGKQSCWLVAADAGMGSVGQVVSGSGNYISAVAVRPAAQPATPTHSGPVACMHWRAVPVALCGCSAAVGRRPTADTEDGELCCCSF